MVYLLCDFLQCEGKGYNDKSDIWALGCILYEMACLERTFEGTNLPAVIHKIVQVSFTPVKGDYSESFKQLVSELLILSTTMDSIRRELWRLH